MKRTVLTFAALSALLWTVPAPGQPVSQGKSDESQRHLVLTKRSEDGFRAFRDALRGGRLGADVHDVNISVSEGSVQVELLRRGAPHTVVRLSEPTSGSGGAGYFDVRALENASAADLVQIGRLLDEVFTSGPFLEELAVRDVERAPLQADEMRSASLEYTVAVIVLGGLGLLLSIGILCMPAPTVDEQ